MVSVRNHLCDHDNWSEHILKALTTGEVHKTDCKAEKLGKYKSSQSKIANVSQQCLTT